MAKCKCGSPEWRRKKQKPKGKGIEYMLICLSCDWEWNSTADYARSLPSLTQEEKERHMLGKYD